MISFIIGLHFHFFVPFFCSFLSSCRLEMPADHDLSHANAHNTTVHSYLSTTYSEAEPPAEAQFKARKISDRSLELSWPSAPTQRLSNLSRCHHSIICSYAAIAPLRSRNHCALLPIIGVAPGIRPNACPSRPSPDDHHFFHSHR